MNLQHNSITVLPLAEREKLNLYQIPEQKRKITAKPKATLPNKRIAKEAVLDEVLASKAKEIV